MAMQQQYAGIEIGGTKLQVVTSLDIPQLVQSQLYPINANAGSAVIRAQIEKALLSLDDFPNLSAIGVGFGGPVDWKKGVIKTSHHVAGWNDFDLKNWLEKVTGRPVVVDNDANVAALAEAAYGAGKHSKNVFYMTIGSGIGGGFVVNGHIYHGRTPGEVEIGHLRLNKNGETLESRCSGWAVNKKIRKFLEQHPGSLLAQISGKNEVPEAHLLTPALEKCDAAAMQIVNEVADDLALGLSHVVHLFHPDIIVIGGGLSLLGERLREPVERQLNKYVMKAFMPPPQIAIAGLAELVVPVGALQLAKNYFLSLQT
jgi:glucokinase